MHALIVKLKSLLWYESEEAARAPNAFDSTLTKDVFDHFRNFTIAFAIGQAGLIAWSLQVHDVITIVPKIFGGVFVATALALFLLNFLHAENAIQRNLKPGLFKRILLSVYWSAYFATALVGCFFNIIRAL